MDTKKIFKDKGYSKMNETQYHRVQRERRKQYSGKFRCSLCNKMKPDNEGQYISLDSKTDVKVCKTHRILR